VIFHISRDWFVVDFDYFESLVLVILFRLRWLFDSHKSRGIAMPNFGLV